MGNFIQSIETAVETAVTVIKVEWGLIDGKIEADAKILATDAGTLLVGLAPAEYAVFKALAVNILADVESLDFAKAETDILNAAEAAGATFVTTMGSPLIQAFLALIKAL